MKNWGHDFLRAQGKEDAHGGEGGSKSTKAGQTKHVDMKNKYGRKKSIESHGDEEHDVDEDVEEHAGTKRKASTKERRPSKKGPGGTNFGKADLVSGDEEPEVDGTAHDEVEHAGAKRKASNKEQKPSKKRETDESHVRTKSGETDLQKGDDVSWNWGGGHPHAKVLDVKDEK